MASFAIKSLSKRPFIFFLATSYIAPNAYTWVENIIERSTSVRYYVQSARASWLLQKAPLHVILIHWIYK